MAWLVRVPPSRHIIKAPLWASLHSRDPRSIACIHLGVDTLYYHQEQVSPKWSTPIFLFTHVPLLLTSLPSSAFGVFVNLPQFTGNDVTFPSPWCLGPVSQSSHCRQDACFPPHLLSTLLWRAQPMVLSDIHFLQSAKAVINSLHVFAYEPDKHEFTKYKCSDHLWCWHSLNKCLSPTQKGCCLMNWKWPCVPCTQFSFLLEKPRACGQKRMRLCHLIALCLCWMLSIWDITTLLQLFLAREFANSKLSLQSSITS